jgi:hypothetical protein
MKLLRIKTPIEDTLQGSVVKYALDLRVTARCGSGFESLSRFKCLLLILSTFHFCLVMLYAIVGPVHHQVICSHYSQYHMEPLICLNSIL